MVWEGTREASAGYDIFITSKSETTSDPLVPKPAGAEEVKKGIPMMLNWRSKCSTEIQAVLLTEISWVQQKLMDHRQIALTSLGEILTHQASLPLPCADTGHRS